MKRKFASRLIYIIGMMGAVGAPAISFLCKFPVLKERNYGQAVSWFAVLILVLCCVPFLKKIREMFKSADATGMWLCIFCVLALIEPIVAGIKLVAFCGLCGNVFAKLMFFISSKLYSEVKDEKPE